MSIFNASEEIRKFLTADFTQVGAIQLQINREVADFLLSRNTRNNRVISKKKVSEYRQKMKDEQWLIGDPIKVSTKGELIDGQHRLTAIPEGKIIPFIVMFGAPPESADTFDQGMRRNALHIARLRGIKTLNGHALSILRFCFIYRTDIANKSQIGARRIIDIVEKYPDLVDAIKFSLSYGTSRNSIRMAPVCAAITRAKLSDFPLSDQDLDYFIYCFQHGYVTGYEKETYRSGIMPCVLRNEVIKMRDRGSGADVRAEIFYKAQSSLIAYQKGSYPRLSNGIKRNCFPVPFIDQMNFKTLEFDPSIKPRA